MAGEKVNGPGAEVARCGVCAAEFIRRTGGRGRRELYCSAACRAEKSREYGRRSYRKKGRPAIHAKVCAVCGAGFLTDNARTQTCGLHCGNKLSRANAIAAGNGWRVFRSHADRWRYYNHLRRARSAGVEKFSPAEVFDRDGWRCGLCGGRVDKKLKYPDPRSASLDHIVPLAAGGAHTRTNVQCAHFGCNSRKRAGAGGQLRLFG